MRHINFSQANAKQLPKVGRREDEVLHVMRYGGNEGRDMVMSVWELTDEDRQAIANGAVICLHVADSVHPAVALVVQGTVEVPTDGKEHAAASDTPNQTVGREAS